MMQIPMEMLFRMITRADSGTGVRTRAGPGQQESFQFDKILGESLAEAGAQLPFKDKKPETAAIGKETAPAEPKKPDDNTDIDVSLAAGEMGNQNLIVFILEGDNESATTPDDSVKNAAEVGSTAIASQADAAAEPEPSIEKADAGQFTVRSDYARATVDRADAKAAQHADDAGSAADGKASAAERPPGEAVKAAPVEHSAAAADKKPVEQPAAAKTEDTAVDTTGDVTARMPIKRTSEGQGNEGSNPEFSRKGNPGPLENENDAAPIRGQKDRTYSETADVARNAAKNGRNAAEGVPEPANNTPMPLAEGLKPEQFRADQQMKQTTLEAPVKAENLFDEMVARIETMKTDSQSKMSIQLKPEFLGKVALEIAMDAAGLHVKISAADGGVRTMINGQINSLIESLGDKGIDVVEVEVATTGANNGAFKESQGDQAQPNHRRNSFRGAKTVDGAVYYTTLQFDTLDYYLDAGVSSVEYRA